MSELRIKNTSESDPRSYKQSPPPKKKNSEDQQVYNKRVSKFEPWVYSAHDRNYLMKHVVCQLDEWYYKVAIAKDGGRGKGGSCIVKFQSWPE